MEIPIVAVLTACAGLVGFLIARVGYAAGLAAATTEAALLRERVDDLEAALAQDQEAAALLAPLYTYWLKPEYTMPVAMLCALVVYRHRENIIRLLNGQEDKIWQRKNKRRP